MIVDPEMEDGNEVPVGRCWVVDNEFDVIEENDDDDGSVTVPGLDFVMGVTEELKAEKVDAELWWVTEVEVKSDTEEVIAECGLVIVVPFPAKVDCDGV